MTTMTRTRTQTRANATATSNALAEPLRLVGSTSARQRSSAHAKFQSVTSLNTQLNRRRTSSETSVTTSRAVRGSTCTPRSRTPSSSGPSGSGSSGSKQTSTDTTSSASRSRSSKELESVSPKTKAPTDATLNHVSKALRSARAVRRRSSLKRPSTSARTKRWKRGNLNITVDPPSVPGAVALRRSISLAAEEEEHSPLSSFSAHQTKPGDSSRRIQRHLSPQSLREARLKRFQLEQSLREIEAAAIASQDDILRPDHHQYHPQLSQIPQPVPIRESTLQRGAPGGDSNPNSPGYNTGSNENDDKRKEEAFPQPPNIHIRLARLNPKQIANHFARGYVVDILPNIAVQNLPLNAATRRIVNTYRSRSNLVSIVGFGQFERRLPGRHSGRWDNWAYLSRLAVSDIGLNGRRRTLDQQMEGERWDVVLAPSLEEQAGVLREFVGFREI